MSNSPRLFRIAILAFLALSLVVMASNADGNALIATVDDRPLVTAPSTDEEAVSFSTASEAFVESEAEELPSPAESYPDVSDPVVENGCFDHPRIIYRQRLRANKFYGCHPAEDAALIVEHPGCGCQVEVPVCLPACLKGVPAVRSRCTHSGRGIVNFCWSNGFHLKVLFRVKGDLVVTYMPLIQ